MRRTASDKKKKGGKKGNRGKEKKHPGILKNETQKNKKTAAK